MYRFRQGFAVVASAALLLLVRAEAAGPDANFYGYSGEFLNGQSSDQYRLPNPNGTYGTPQQNVREPLEEECCDEENGGCCPHDRCCPPRH